MSTQPISPNPNGNPFDVPLNSEIEESKQRQRATQAASANGNPFDAPLASEIAEQNAKANPDQYASDTRQMLVAGMTGLPTPNMNEADKASFQNGKAAGAGTATLLSAASLLGVLAPHLPDLDKAWKIAATLMGGSATVDHVIHVLKTLRGK